MTGDPEDPDDALLIEQVAGAHREAPQAFGELPYHPAWYDLAPGGRERAFARALALRTAEAALDPRGLSTTAKAVLARIRS
jgi:hypothetical protein